MKTEMPADIAAISDEDLTTIEASLIAEFDEQVDAEANDLALLTEIAEAIEAVRAEAGARVAAAEENAQKVAALADRVHATIDPEEGDDDEAPADAQTEAAPVAEEPIADAEDAPAETEERELVTASADKSTKAPSAKAVARRSPAPVVSKPAPEVVITAAADIPGVAGGTNLGDTVTMARALHAKARTLSNHSGYVPVASINLPIEHKVGADLAHNLDVLKDAANPASLTAAGWCAPSQNIYDLFGIDAGDGLIDLPTVQVTRGGVNVPSFIGYADAVENGGLWTWTEEDQDSGYATKPCVYIPCPDFTDYRLEAEGICVTNGNLTDRAFPELTSRYIQLVLNTHLHRVSASIVNKIAATTGPTIAMNNIPAAGTSGRLLSALELQASVYRSKYRMSVNSVLEVLLPVWARGVLRADLAMRTGVDLVNVSDAMLDEYFATRRVRPQFLHDFQPLTQFAEPSGEVKSWPGIINFIMYAAGGYVRGDGGTIDLGVVRDSVLNATNDYTAAWTEQMFLVAQMGPNAVRVEVDLATDGHTGCCPELLV